VRVCAYRVDGGSAVHDRHGVRDRIGALVLLPTTELRTEQHGPPQAAPLSKIHRAATCAAASLLVRQRQDERIAAERLLGYVGLRD
jgi:hypothetical protein